jgi:predicted nucleic acid-binding protein
MVFWDSSAVVPLLFQEAQSQRAMKVWHDTDGHIAWDWLRVEVEAALIRRKAGVEIWSQWRLLQRGFTFLCIDGDEISSLLALNRGFGLRAADAGHLFVFDRLCGQLPELSLLTFDKELSETARRLGLPVDYSCP